MRMQTRSLTRGALLAAVYAALTLLCGLLGIGYGPVQLRVAEALTILPVFSPRAIAGLTVGCALANVLGMLVGSSLGWIDVVCGTGATLLAGCLSWLLRRPRLRGLPVLATLPPVLVNAVVVGLELTLVLQNGWVTEVFWFHFTTVAIGQLLACTGLGLVLYVAIKKYNLEKLFL